MKQQENRLAMLAVVVEDPASVEALNGIVHDFAAHIIGRFGLPCKERGVSLISLAMDAPVPIISALSGQLGMLPGVSAKAVYAKTFGNRRPLV